MDFRANILSFEIKLARNNEEMSYHKIIDGNCEIVFEDSFWAELEQAILNINPSQVFVLTDENTKRDCLPIFHSKLPKNVTYKQLCIPAGEEHKNLETCIEVWQSLSDARADRQSLLINLGGGVVCDLGGFVATTYMRGIKWINIPTTLLSMVDASIGGKTGVDFNGLKNIIGIIRNPYLVGIEPMFLETLSYREKCSGLAEMLKHALLSDEDHWLSLQNLDLENITTIKEYIYKSISIKHHIVSKDRYESGMRKQLNFGHTIGHAIESYFLQNHKPILHGEAVAAGMLIELKLSMELLNFPKSTFQYIEKDILKIFGKISLQEIDLDQIINNLAFDKKNVIGQINFVLLHDFGTPQIDCQVPKSMIAQALEYYKKA